VPSDSTAPRFWHRREGSGDRGGYFPRIKTCVTVVGLPDAAVKESRERVKSAVANSGFAFPDQIVTVTWPPPT